VRARFDRDVGERHGLMHPVAAGGFNCNDLKVRSSHISNTQDGRVTASVRRRCENQGWYRVSLTKSNSGKSAVAVDKSRHIGLYTPSVRRLRGKEANTNAD
ncbi:MAG: hypothetical protein V3U62_03140, partial [Sedimenticolaceae bacterium]